MRLSFVLNFTIYSSLLNDLLFIDWYFSNICKSNQNCKAWTWVTDKFYVAGQRRNCFLKGDGYWNGRMTSQKNLISGGKKCAPAIPTPAPTPKPGTLTLYIFLSPLWVKKKSAGIKTSRFFTHKKDNKITKNSRHEFLSLSKILVTFCRSVKIFLQIC